MRWLDRADSAVCHFDGDPAVPAQSPIAAIDADAPVWAPYHEVYAIPKEEINAAGSASSADPAIVNKSSYAPVLISANSAWRHHRGQAVTVAVLDTGIDSEHPDIARSRISTQAETFVLSESVDDIHGHGTHVAGIIGSTLNNGIGAAGIAPECMLLPIKVLDRNNVGAWSYLIEAVIYAVDNGARVINMSLGSSSMPEAMSRAIDYAASRDVLLVAAAGNYASENPFYPAADERVMSVGASTMNDTLWPLSNRGSWVDLLAPGAVIYGAHLGGDFVMMSGTSQAAPHVAGVAALLMGAYPSLSAAEIRSRIMANLVPVGEYGRLSADGIFGSIEERRHGLYLPFAARS